jgi:hypothetical protein
LCEIRKELKYGAFNMILKANGKGDFPMTPENFHVEITNEENAHHFLRYKGYLIRSRRLK